MIFHPKRKPCHSCTSFRLSFKAPSHRLTTSKVFRGKNSPLSSQNKFT